MLADEIGTVPAREGEAATLEARLGGEGPSFEWTEGRLRVQGPSVPQLLRALAAWRGFAREGHIPARHAEKCLFDTLGLMIDASRNAVPTVATVKYLLRRMALMGLNRAMLYTEDTYVVPSQPYFGYLRGGYTEQELRELDEYAATLGIELMPCIQTLGHLAQILRWPQFSHVKDTGSVLLVDEPATYELLEQMIAAACAPYRTRRIHIGMDEAHDLGLGRYLQRHGLKPKFELMSRHLSRVSQICERLGLEPMIWSDMYFRMASSTGNYYDREARIPVEVAKDIPQSVTLVYWDYYHIDGAFYEEWIDRHRALGKEPVFAAGLWTWEVFWQDFAAAAVNTTAGMQACQRRGVRHAFTTAWGDDGNEVDLLSILPGLQHFAELGYAEAVADACLRRQLWGSSNIVWDHWRQCGRIDDTSWRLPILDGDEASGTGSDSRPKPVPSPVNPSKWLLWQDPLLGLFDVHIAGLPLTDYYRKVADDLAAIRVEEGEFYRGQQMQQLAVVLIDKAELGVDIRRAYEQKDIPALRKIIDERLPRLIGNVRRLHDLHRRTWESLYKPFGWEILDRRYAGLVARLEAVAHRLQPFVDGQVERVEELECPRLPVKDWPAGQIGFASLYRHITSSTICS